MPESKAGDGLRERRRSSRLASSTEKLTSTANAVESEIERSLLQLWDDLPSWRRDNAFIHSGYRQIRASYLHSFQSLFYLHNEFVNIWSHLSGAIVAISFSAYLYCVIHPRFDSATSSDVFVFGCFFGGAILCLGMSATFHTLVDHSEAVAKWGNKLDYTGIVALIVGSYVPALYYGFFCNPGMMTVYLYLVSICLLMGCMAHLFSINLVQICLLGIGCATVSWVERFRKPAWRPYRAAMFISLGLSGVVPVIHGLATFGFQKLNEQMSVALVATQGAMYIFGAVLYAVCVNASSTHLPLC